MFSMIAFLQTNIVEVRASPSITLTPRTSNLGAHIVVNGTGFLPPDPRSCTLSSPGSAAVLARSPTCSVINGVAAASFIVGNVVPGQYLIQITAGSDFAQTVLFVVSSPFIQLSVGPSNGFASVGQPASGPAGSHIIISGSNFLSTACVGPSGIVVAAGTAACHVFTAPFGAFMGRNNVSATFTVGNVQPGVYVVSINGFQGEFVQAQFIVTSNDNISSTKLTSSNQSTTIQTISYLIGSPSIILRPSSASVGATVDVSGSNLSATDSASSLSGSAVSTTSNCMVSGGSLVGSYF